MNDLTKAQLAELEAARDHLYALRNWPEARVKWMAAIRAGKNVLGMAPQVAHEKLIARDRIYERARHTVTRLVAPLGRPTSKR